MLVLAQVRGNSSSGHATRGTVLRMVHLSRASGGGLAVGVGALGRALWVQREPRCHRWSVWRTRRPRGIAGDADDTLGTAGVREPRRPRPGGDAGVIALPPPDIN